jgi:glycerol-3-phosphate dehydrogenase (NAD(P)+)
MKLAVLGAGAWGTAIGINLATRHAVTLWTRDATMAKTVSATRTNTYLPDTKIPDSIRITADLPETLEGCELVLVATTTAGLRAMLKSVTALAAKVPLVWLCKGFESETARLPHQIAAEELTAGRSRAVLSGPSFAAEIARGMPAALTLASDDAAFAARVAHDLHHDHLRIYSSDDVIGVEIAGAVKNVMAIASGICDGLKLGNNARAALITRGLTEITRLGLKLGGRMETFMGLAGVGDLVLTCTGDLSRNRSVGLKLAQGVALASILRDLGHVAEGVYTSRAVNRLAKELKVDMPVTQAVCHVMDDALSPRDAVRELLEREPGSEL